MIKRLLGPTNRRIRLCVGLLLAALFCIQCTQTEAFRRSRFVTVIDAKTVTTAAPDVLRKVRRLARTDHIALLEYCLANYERTYRDYTCTFIKQERINGRAGNEQHIRVKFMESPYSVAMAWTPKTARTGDRVLYVEGRDGNKMRVRPKNKILRALAGGSVLRDPAGREAMQHTLRPVNVFGFKRSMQNLLKVYRKAKQNGDLTEACGEEFVEVAGRPAIALIRHLPPKEDYPSGKTVIFIDLEHLVLICIEGYDWDDKLTCMYVYKDLKFNADLTAADFLPEANGMPRAN